MDTPRQYGIEVYQQLLAFSTPKRFSIRILLILKMRNARKSESRFTKILLSAYVVLITTICPALAATLPRNTVAFSLFHRYG